jgi:hypothetical protein
MQAGSCGHAGEFEGAVGVAPQPAAGDDLGALGGEAELRSEELDLQPGMASQQGQDGRLVGGRGTPHLEGSVRHAQARQA